MDGTPEQNAVIEKLNKSIVRTRWLRAVSYATFLLFVASVAEVNGQRICPSYVVSFALLAVAVFFAFWAYRTWRCPVCQEFLRGTTNPKFCPECGVRYESMEDSQSSTSKPV